MVGRVPDGFRVVREHRNQLWYVDADGQPSDHRGPGFRTPQEAIGWISEQVTSGVPVRGSSWRESGRVHHSGEDEIVYMLSAVLGFILSVVTGGVLTFVFGWSGSAVLLGTVVGAAGGTIVGFLLFIGPEQLAKAWRPAAYVVWRAWGGLEWVASWASLLLPAILTVVVSALLS